MVTTKNDKLLVGVILILLTKVLHWSNLFLIVGVIIAFDALFGTDSSKSEDTHDY